MQELSKATEKFGFFQKRILLLLCLSGAFNAPFVIWFVIFPLYTHRCSIAAIDDASNSTCLNRSKSHVTLVSKSSCLFNITPIETGPDGTQRWSQCYTFNTIADSWRNDQEEFTTINRSDVGKCTDGWEYDTPDKLLTVPMEFDLVCDRSWLVPLASSLYMFGLLAGSIIGGFVSDRWGRRKALLGSVIGMCAGAAALAVIPIWSLSHPILFMMGCCCATRVGNEFVMISEIIPEKYRSLAGNMNNGGMAVNMVLAALVNYLLPNWRHMMGLMAAADFLLIIPIYLYVKESLKWLLQSKRNDDAMKLLKEISRINRVEINDMELSQFLRKETINHKKIEAKSLVVEEETGKPTRYTYIHLLKAGFLRKRILILVGVWFAVNLEYYGLFFNVKNLAGNRYLNGVLAGLVEIPSTIFCQVSIRKMGGRLSNCMMTGLAAVCCLITTGLSKYRPAVTVFSLMGLFFGSAAYANAWILTGEFFPTLLRNQAYGLCSAVARISGITAPFFIYLGEKYYAGIPYLVTGLVGILAAFGVYFLPETKSLPLPDTMEEAAAQEKYTQKLCGKHQDSTKVEQQTSPHAI
ncbi:unnamed protein product [Clavelina lepadiformis]|uniref:Major facilitator superfamily (MFS) profile domain-containing protein n=2 Tax=Clavelina lepadiformis TaxID=159417 RepID=A0ABP0F0Q4_CLALP